MEKSSKMHWADKEAQRVIKEKGDKEKYVCAAGITPSGTIHIGNFRETISVELVVRALRDAGKKVRFVYSWDDFDVFRKIPKNLPKQDLLKKYLRQPIVDVPDVLGKEESFARANEVAVEQVLPHVGIIPEYVYQHKKYRDGDYADQIKTALKHTKEITEILDKFRKEPLASSWLPVSVYDPKTNTDEVKDLKWDGDDTLTFINSKGNNVSVKISEGKYVKLPWRVDWAMRWTYEDLDFEPAGKDHYAAGGSRDTCKEIVKVFGGEEPVGFAYEWIKIKGGGQFSSSAGVVTTLHDVLDIYEPEMVRWLFAGTRPGTEFAISFDLDVIKIYEDFDKCERIYFGEHQVKDEEKAKQQRVYELSCVRNVPETMPFQPSFRHLTEVLLVYELDVARSIDYYSKHLKNTKDKERLRTRAICAKNWIEKYAPDDFKYSVRTSVEDIGLSDDQKKALRETAKILKEKEWEDNDLHEALYVIITNNKLTPADYFKAAYGVLIGRTKGPKLARFMLIIGREKVASLFEQVK